MQPTFTETVNDASRTQIIGGDEAGSAQGAAEPTKTKARKPQAATSEEVTDADPT